MAHVLVIDDDRGLGEILQAALGDEGHTVAVESNGDRAVSLLKTSPVPLVVLLDVYLTGRGNNPVLTALEADASLAETHRILVMTAGTPQEAEAVMASIPSSLAGLLLKPFDLDDLLGIVAEAARGLPGGDG